jgi:hypothetical protein
VTDWARNYHSLKIFHDTWPQSLAVSWNKPVTLVF